MKTASLKEASFESRMQKDSLQQALNHQLRNYRRDTTTPWTELALRPPTADMNNLSKFARKNRHNFPFTHDSGGHVKSGLEISVASCIGQRIFRSKRPMQVIILPL